jgi:hypothetical protein
LETKSAVAGASTNVDHVRILSDLQLAGADAAEEVVTDHIPNPPLAANEVQDSRGRVRVYLGIGHPDANSGGWQWRARLVAQRKLGRRLHKSEHVHHLPELRGEPANRADDRPERLEVLACEYHGRLHAFATLVRRWRMDDGTFAPGTIGDTSDWPRYGAILGPAAREARS